MLYTRRLCIQKLPAAADNVITGHWSKSLTAKTSIFLVILMSATQHKLNKTMLQLFCKKQMIPVTGSVLAGMAIENPTTEVCSAFHSIPQISSVLNAVLTVLCAVDLLLGRPLDELVPQNTSSSAELKPFCALQSLDFFAHLMH